MEIEVNKIKPDKNQPRKTFDEESLHFLAESILGNGLFKSIEIDENNIIIDGERRWRAHKIASLKKIECVIIKIRGNGGKRLRRQLISDIQDEEIPTGERYEALAKLYESEKIEESTVSKEDFCKSLGISTTTLNNAFDHLKIKEEEPELVKEIGASLVAETKHLPKEERREVLEALKDKEITKTPIAIREVVKAKKEELETKKELEKLRETTSRKEVKITTDRDRAYQIRDEIMETQNHFNKLISNVRWARKTKFFFNKPKDKDNFIRFLDGASERARKWADELDDLKEEISIEIIKE